MEILSPSEFSSASSLDWETLFDAWKKRESGIWDAHFKERGYESWEDYRLGSKGTLAKLGLDPIRLNDLALESRHIVDTSISVPKLYCAPFPGWSIHNPRRDHTGRGRTESILFRDIVTYGEILKNDRVATILPRLQKPEPLTAIVLETPVGTHLVLDGCHTLSAYAISAAQGIQTMAPLELHVIKGQVKNCGTCFPYLNAWSSHSADFPEQDWEIISKEDIQVGTHAPVDVFQGQAICRRCHLLASFSCVYGDGYSFREMD